MPETPFDGSPSTVYSPGGGTTTFGGNMPDFTNPFSAGSPEFSYLETLMAQQGAHTAPAASTGGFVSPFGAGPEQDYLSRLGAPAPMQAAPAQPAPSPMGQQGLPTQPGQLNFGNDIFNYILGALQPQRQQQPQQPQYNTSQQPFTYATAGPQQFGFQGPFQGGIAETLARMGYPDTTIPNLLTNQTGIMPPNYSRALQQTGGLGLFSPQGFRNLGPSGQQYTQGLYETMAGIPIQDLIWAALQPFLGMQQGRTARTRRLGE